MKILKAIFLLLLALTSTSVFGERGPENYRMQSFESVNPYEEAAVDDDKKIRRPSSEEIYKYKYELEEKRKWQDTEEHCGDRCIYPDSNHK